MSGPSPRPPPQGERGDAESHGEALTAHDLHVAAPSVWPFVVGLALAFALFGIVTSLAFTAAGLLGVALGLAGWIADLRRESLGER